MAEKRLQDMMQVRRSADRATLRSTNMKRTKEDISKSVSADNHISSAINTIEELDKVANRLAKRLRDWYALYYPELTYEHDDHKVLADTILATGNRESSMGGTCTEEDLVQLASQAQLLSTIYGQRELLLTYLEERMKQYAPNLTHVAGAMIGAKLIAHAGSLKRLAMFPAGTVQLLGAETALFRHLRNKKARPPKHGVIFNHQLLQRSNKKGRVARVLADCISIASRVDYFKGEFMAESLVKKVEAAV